MLIIILFSLIVSTQSKELIFAQTLFRHGSRTPIGTYPNDIYNSSIWPVPLGHLLPLGMEQSFRQGLKLNERYMIKYSLVNTSYNVNEITVRSTDYDRTLMSAYSHLVGFYINSSNTNPGSVNNWPFNYSPIPVHTVPMDEDYLLSTNFPCERKSNEIKKQLDRKEYKNFMESKKHIIEKIEKFSGKNITDDKDLREFFDTIYVERYHNFSLPEWITEGLYEDIRNLSEIVWDYVSGDEVIDGVEENVELIKLNAGYLLNTLINNMVKSIKEYKNNVEGRKKYYIYSAHDSTLSALLRTLGIKQKYLGSRTPEYSAVIAFEVWKINGVYSVNIIYSKNADEPFEDITKLVTNCINVNNVCTLNNFIDGAEKYILDIDTKNGTNTIDKFNNFCNS